MITLIIIIVILLFIVCLLSINNFKDSAVFLLSLLWTITIFIVVCVYKNTVFPIDVYRGNTTLEITYKDGVAIDSTVVWKNK